MNVAVIGGGAAGFFAAINICENHPGINVTIFEKSQKVLAKVKVSGGGRCNVTNGCTSISDLIKAYPRGSKQLKKLFPHFHTAHAMAWFENRGVPLVIQDDNCVFPISQDSQSIIDCFMNEANRLGVKISLGNPVTEIIPSKEKIVLAFRDHDSIQFDKVVVTTGGSPKLNGLDWLAGLGHNIQTPVPSLFTFNMPNESVRDLMGLVVEETITSIQGTKLKSDGPLLITHWGMSGPSILKLSAFGARILEGQNYNCILQVNWANQENHEIVKNDLSEVIQENSHKLLSNYRPYNLPDRLWKYLLAKSEFPNDKRWNELGKKGMNKLINLLTNDQYQVEGKTTFKEEFVTCGGVDLDSIHMSTMESKVVPNLYFAGEVIDIDGITGGYNFQAAWTTAYVAAKLNSNRI